MSKLDTLNEHNPWQVGEEFMKLEKELEKSKQKFTNFEELIMSWWDSFPNEIQNEIREFNGDEKL